MGFISNLFKSRGASMESIAYNNQSNLINLFYNRRTEQAYFLFNRENLTAIEESDWLCRFLCYIERR